MRRDPVPAIYYTYILISNLFQLCAPVVWVAKLEERDQTTTIIADILFFFGATTSLNFKTCIILERYLSFMSFRVNVLACL